MSGTRARLTMRSGRSRSSMVNAKEPLATAATSVSPAVASAFWSAATLARSGSISSTRAIARPQDRTIHARHALGHPRVAGGAEAEHGVDGHTDATSAGLEEQTQPGRQAAGAVTQSVTQVEQGHDATAMERDTEDRRVVAGHRRHHGHS